MKRTIQKPEPDEGSCVYATALPSAYLDGAVVADSDGTGYTLRLPIQNVMVERASPPITVDFGGVRSFVPAETRVTFTAEVGGYDGTLALHMTAAECRYLVLLLGGA